MWTYYFVVIYTMIITGFVKPATREHKRIKFIMLLIPIFIYAAIRGNGNGDYFNYINRGQYIYSFSEIFTRDIGMEVGYKFLAYMIKILGLPRQFIIIIFNTISGICIYKFVKRYSNHWTMSIVLYLPIFFLFEMHAARTGVAISIVFLGLQFIESREFLKFFLIVMLASCFHTTAIITLILYWLYEVKLKRNVGIIVLLIETLFFMFVSIDEIVTILLSFLRLNSWLNKYVAYSSSMDYGYAMKLYDPRILIGIIVYIVCSSFFKEGSKRDRFSLNCIFLYTFLLIAFSSHTFLAYRISSYFYYPIIILLPKLISDNKVVLQDKKSTNVVMLYTILFSFTILNIIYASQNPEYIVFWKNGQAILPW